MNGLLRQDIMSLAFVYSIGGVWEGTKRSFGKVLNNYYWEMLNVKFCTTIGVTFLGPEHMRSFAQNEEQILLKQVMWG